MKDRILDASMCHRSGEINASDFVSFADFPRTLDQRVYHLGLRAGEVANRIVSFSPPASRILLLRYAD